MAQSTKPKMKRSALRTVDPLAGCSQLAQVYEDEDGVVWHVMLNFTNVSFGTYGNNKFYMVQLIQEGSQYKVFRKWGRVGAKTPQRAVEPYQESLEKAKASFRKKFEDKSGNEWPEAHTFTTFEPVAGKYLLVELDDEDVADEELKPPTNSASSDADGEDVATHPVASTLPESVQNVLQLICDAELMESEVAAMKLDLKRLPLGRLSKSQISRGYALLEEMDRAVREISQLANEPEDAAEHKPSSSPLPTRTRTRRQSPRVAANKRALSATRMKRVQHLKDQLNQLSSAFYSLIPHDFGRQKPPLISTEDEIKLKIDLLEVLVDLDISQKLDHEKRRATAKDSDMNPLDAQYRVLNVDMTPVPAKEEEFKIIQRYVETTHAPTHLQYKLRIRSVLKLHRPEEDEFQNVFESVDNHRLLWHGSRLCNVVGILAKGLRVAPPEAPSNGYMFGKGIYFADSVSKSANYCWATPEQPRGVILLAEVALGPTINALAATDMDYSRLQQQVDTVNKAEKTGPYQSLRGVGRMAAPLESYETMPRGTGKAHTVTVPCGEFEPTGVTDGELLYNEFVVYRREQVRLRYLVSLDFLYDHEGDD